MKVTADNRRTALVTGSTSGIGLAVALALAGEGFAVAFNGRREREQADAHIEKAERLNGKKGSCLYLRGDIAEAESRDAIVREIERRYGRLDVLVNNAGITTEKRLDLLELSEEQMLRVFRVNLIGPFLLTSALSRLMTPRKDTGYIINISSISAYTPSLNRADYCMSKAGMTMMTKLYALKLAGMNVRCFEIRPGIIHTDMTEPVKEKYDKLIAAGLLPLARWGTPADVATVVMAVVRGHHDYSTGGVLEVDGGFHLHGL